MDRTELQKIGTKLGVNCGGEGGKPGPCPMDGVKTGKTVGGMDHMQATTDRGLTTDQISHVISKLKVGSSVHVVFTAMTKPGEDGQGRSMTGKVVRFGKLKGSNLRAAVIDVTKGDLGNGEKVLNPHAGIHALSWN